MLVDSSVLISRVVIVAQFWTFKFYSNVMNRRLPYNLRFHSHPRPISVQTIGHEAAVWCVLYVSGSQSEFEFVTGSADHSIRLWKVDVLLEPSYSRVRCFLGHTDCVRCLAALDRNRFLSASNDASIRAWDVQTGACIGEFCGHPNSVYAVATQKDVPVFVSSGEDCSVRIWRIPGEHEWGEKKRFGAVQCIPIPCRSARCVALSPNGDIVVGGR